MIEIVSENNVVQRDGLYRSINLIRHGIWRDRPFTGEVDGGLERGISKKRKKKGLGSGTIVTALGTTAQASTATT